LDLQFSLVLAYWRAFGLEAGQCTLVHWRWTGPKDAQQEIYQEVQKG